MLRSLRDLEDYTVRATDGDLGTVVKFLFDDEHWIIRYLVVRTGGPIFQDGRQVLISPISFGRADWHSRRFHLALTMDRIYNSPSVDLDKPVSRQQEQHYSHYYGYPNYWGSAGLWGTGIYPTALGSGPKRDDLPPQDPRASSGDVHLRCDSDVRGYRVEGTNGVVGHIRDFVVEDGTWRVRYMVVNTRNWWFGRHVLISPRWAYRISWVERKVYVDLSRSAVKESPEWEPAALLDRAYETRLHDHYGRPTYWVGPNEKPAATSSDEHAPRV